jgi:uncharacterized membrane protein YdjX (TVP38/TMEM64 family)
VTSWVKNAIAGNRRILFVVTGALVLAGIVYAVWRYDTSGWIAFLIHEKTHPLLFVGLMAALPSFGFPMSVFLVLVGVKFGIGGGIAVTALILPVQMAISFLVTKSLLRPKIEGILRRRGYRMPRIPDNRRALFTALFVGIPGLPYAMKNYLLALTRIPFRYYLGIGWPVHLAVTTPFVGLGGSTVEMNLLLAALFGGILVGLYVMLTRMKPRFQIDPPRGESI